MALSLQDKYDQYTALIDGIGNIVDELDENYFKDYIDELNNTKYYAEDRRNEIEQELIEGQKEEQEKDERQQTREYYNGAL